MPLRGSVRFLLPSLRPRAVHGPVMAACALAVAVSGLAFLDAFPGIKQDGLAQTLRQSVWSRALSGQSAPVRWSFGELTANLSLTPSSKVPRLGLSASMRTEPIAPPASIAATQLRKSASANNKTALAKNKTVKEPAAGDLTLREFAIGDSITFTAADGATCVYRVTGRPVVDPHLAGGDARRAVGAAPLFECGPLETLIMRARQAVQEPAPPGDQQKL